MFTTKEVMDQCTPHSPGPRCIMPVLAPSTEKAIVIVEGPRGRHPAQKRTGGRLVDMSLEEWSKGLGMFSPEKRKLG